MRAHHLDLGGVVRERGADLVALELVVLVAAHGERRAIRVDRAAQSLRAARAARTRGAAASAAPGPLRRRGCRTSCRRIRSCRRSSPSAPVHDRPTLPKPLRDCEFVEVAFRRRHVARSAAAAADVQRERAVADVHVAGSRRLPSPPMPRSNVKLPLAPIMRLASGSRR